MFWDILGRKINVFPLLKKLCQFFQQKLIKKVSKPLYIALITIECRKTETKVITTANKKYIYIYISQRANKDTFKLRKARENATDQVAISFSFKSDWFRKWREFSASIIEQVKPNQSNPRLLITLNYKLLYYSMIIQSYFIGNGVNHKWKHLRQTTQKCLQNCEAYFSL